MADSYEANISIHGDPLLKPVWFTTGIPLSSSIGRSPSRSTNLKHLAVTEVKVTHLDQNLFVAPQCVLATGPDYAYESGETRSTVDYSIRYYSAVEHCLWPYNLHCLNEFDSGYDGIWQSDKRLK